MAVTVSMKLSVFKRLNMRVWVGYAKDYRKFWENPLPFDFDFVRMKYCVRTADKLARSLIKCHNPSVFHIGVIHLSTSRFLLNEHKS